MKRAEAKGTKVAEETRSAVDAYSTGVTVEDLKLLDVATRETRRHLAAMIGELDSVSRKALDASGNIVRYWRIRQEITNEVTCTPTRIKFRVRVAAHLHHKSPLSLRERGQE